MTRFAKVALSGLTALSLSLAPMPASAGPDSEDVVKTLAGLAVLGLVANQLNDRKKKRRAAATAATPTYDPYGSIERHQGKRVIDGNIRRPDQGSRAPRDARRARLPDHCLRIVETGRGDRLVYGKRCLNKNYVYANELPRHCELLVRTENRTRPVYGARCLSREGWRVAGR